MRGNRDCGSIPACAGEPSPSLRGLPRAAEYRGSIPACAGEPPKRCAMSTMCRVYPRVCGGTRPRGTERDSHYGLSPRVRGNQGITRRGPRWSRSIPACAGEPSTSRGRTARSTVYPRVCGGTLRPRWSRRSVVGLSPRVRGNPVQSFHTKPPSGSIPACAGEPASTTMPRQQETVYPRVCGGTQGF